MSRHVAHELSVCLPELDAAVRRVRALPAASTQFWNALRALLAEAAEPLLLPFPDANGVAPSDESLLRQVLAAPRRLLQASFDLINPNELAFLTATTPRIVVDQLLLAVAVGAAEVVYAATCDNCGAVCATFDGLDAIPSATLTCGVCSDSVSIQNVRQVAVFFRLSSAIVHVPQALPRCVESEGLASKRVTAFFVPRNAHQQEHTPVAYAHTATLARGKYTLFDPISGCRATLEVEEAPHAPTELELELLLHGPRQQAAAAAAAFKKPVRSVAARVSELAAASQSLVLRCHEGEVTFRVHNDTPRSALIGVYHALDLRTEAFVDEPPAYLRADEFMAIDPTLRPPLARSRTATSAASAVSSATKNVLKIDRSALLACEAGGTPEMLRDSGDAAALEHVHAFRRLVAECAARHRGLVADTVVGDALVLFGDDAAALAAATEIAVKWRCQHGAASQRLAAAATLVLHSGPAVLSGGADPARSPLGAVVELFGATVAALRSLLELARRCNAVEWPVAPEAPDAPLFMSTAALTDGADALLGLIGEHFTVSRTSRTAHVAPDDSTIVLHRVAVGSVVREVTDGEGNAEPGSPASVSQPTTSAAKPLATPVAAVAGAMISRLSILNPATYEAPAPTAGLFNGAPVAQWPHPIG